MNRVGIAALALTLGCVFALPAYSVSTTVGRCTLAAQTILASADPLDRDPPPRVVAAITSRIGLSQLSAVLATVLLDRFSCAGAWNGADWLFSKPALTWQFNRTFDRRGLIALYASSADMGKNTVGLNRGALRLYNKDMTQLDDSDVDCLMRRATGAPTGSRWPPTGAVEVACPHDFPVPLVH